MNIFRQRLVQWGILWAFFYPAAPAVRAGADQSRILTTAAEVRNLSEAEA